MAHIVESATNYHRKYADVLPECGFEIRAVALIPDSALKQQLGTEPADLVRALRRRPGTASQDRKPRRRGEADHRIAARRMRHGAGRRRDRKRPQIRNKPTRDGREMVARRRAAVGPEPGAQFLLRLKPVIIGIAADLQIELAVGIADRRKQVDVDLRVSRGSATACRQRPRPAHRSPQTA